MLLVRSVERRARANGDAFLKVTFADRTGTLTTNVWDDVDEVEALLRVGGAYRVYGKYEVHERFGPQLRLEGFDPAADGSYDPSELRAGPPVPVEELERRLRALVASVQDPAMRALLDAVLGEGTATWAEYRIAPAAKRVHQAYRHGLLEHCLTVAEAVAGAAGVFPGIDRDLAVSAALVHDLGKLEAYELVEGDSVELTDAGRLRGEIVLGYERPAPRARRDPGDRRGTQAGVPAHHPQPSRPPRARQPGGAADARGVPRAHDGQPRRQARDHRSLEQERAPGSDWSGFDRAFGGSVYFAPTREGGGGPPAAAPEAPAAPAVLPQVPRGAFEESDAWQPPHPDDLDGPPVPAEPFTAPPEHDEIAAAARPVAGSGLTDGDPLPSSPQHTGAETVAAQRRAPEPSSAGAGPAEPEPLPF